MAAGRSETVKTIGMVGGTSWVSTLEYYRLLNEEINRRLGGVEAARCVLFSLNFGDVDRRRRERPDLSTAYPLVRDAAAGVAAIGTSHG